MESTFRTAKKKSYPVTVQKTENGDLFIALPDEIVDVFGIKEGDIAIWEKIGERKFSVMFVNSAMCSFVEMR